jgi:ABC-type transporter Mla subunit MlaD
LKADAQRVVSIVKGDKAKTQVYCEINDLGEQIGEADQKRDDNKAEALSRQVTELEKKLGPEYSALVNDLNNVDPNSSEGREIDSILAPLDDSCD